MSKWLLNQLKFDDLDKQEEKEGIKELYLNVKRYLVREFNNALQENRIDQVTEMKKMIEKLEIYYKNGEIEKIEKFGEIIVGVNKNENFEEALRRKSKEANEEAPNDPNSEFIPERELKDGEIKVNSLPI